MDILFTILVGVIKVLHYVTHPLYVYRSKGKKKCVPAIKNDILKISATDLAKKIRKKELTSAEICKAYIDRIKEVNSIINAVVEDRFVQALQDAKDVDDYITSCPLNEDELEKDKPLLGVPLTVKESCGVEGLSYSVGTLSRVGYKAETDGELVARLKASGAIPLLVSNTPELCLSWESYNLITGTTNNPYDTTCTSGGSSGGEGALLGAGASVIGIGSDIAGSIRLPAMNNCIFGHKPTPKIAPIKGHFPYCYDERFQKFLVIGPMTRYAKDLTLMMKILVGEKQTEQLRLNEKVDLSKVNVYFMEDCGSPYIAKVQKEIKTAIKKATQYLKTHCGATIKDHKFMEFKYGIQVCGKTIFSIKDIPNPLKGQDLNLEAEMIKSLFGNSKFTPNLLFFLILQKLFDSLVADHTTECAILKKKIVNHLGNNGVLLFPIATASASKQNELYFTIPSVIYSLIANALGLPSTSVPCGLDRNGMPIGIQVMAAPYQDRLCFAVAEELEKCFGGWIPPK